MKKKITIFLLGLIVCMQPIQASQQGTVIEEDSLVQEERVCCFQLAGTAEIKKIDLSNVSSAEELIQIIKNRFPRLDTRELKSLVFLYGGDYYYSTAVQDFHMDDLWEANFVQVLGRRDKVIEICWMDLEGFIVQTSVDQNDDPGVPLDQGVAEFYKKNKVCLMDCKSIIRGEVLNSYGYVFKSRKTFNRVSDRAAERLSDFERVTRDYISHDIEDTYINNLGVVQGNFPLDEEGRTLAGIKKIEKPSDGGAKDDDELSFGAQTLSREYDSLASSVYDLKLLERELCGDEKAIVLEDVYAELDRRIKELVDYNLVNKELQKGVAELKKLKADRKQLDNKRWAEARKQAEEELGEQSDSDDEDFEALIEQKHKELVVADWIDN